MCRLRPSVTSALLIGLLALAGPAQSSGSIFYRATLSGHQELEWKLDGATTGCESRHGTGSGRLTFNFHNSGSTLAAPTAKRNSMAFTLSIPSAASGTITGAFSDTLAARCEADPPREATNSPTTGCGSAKFSLRADFLYRNDGFVYVTGVPAPGPGSAGGECPFPFEQRFEHASSEAGLCGDGTQIWKRSWGVVSAQGRGLFASRIAITPRALLRPKHRTIILTGAARVACTVPSEYSGGVQITGKLTYALTLKRFR